MLESTASKTAEYMALFRALESSRPATKRLFNDRFAAGFLRPKFKLVDLAARIPAAGQLLPWIIDHRWPGARPAGVARTRFIDDLLVRALKEGIRQVVILGAGFDCRAYRIDSLEGVRVFEVDHPNTLQAKRQHLSRLLETMPNNVRFLAVDFNTTRLDDALRASEFDGTKPAFIIWEGVTNYLTAEAVDATLRFVGSLASGTQILFTYVDRKVLEDNSAFPGGEKLFRTLKEAGESWTFGFDPAELDDYLKERGMRLIDDLGSVEIRQRYMERTKRNLTGYEFYRAALALVV
ncbi:MAG TPA: SAM-dependent methyltransferase [Blastocatellia bacterium]